MKCLVTWCNETRLRGALYCSAHLRDHAAIAKAKAKTGEPMPSARDERIKFVEFNKRA